MSIICQRRLSQTNRPSFDHGGEKVQLAELAQFEGHRERVMFTEYNIQNFVLLTDP